MAMPKGWVVVVCCAGTDMDVDEQYLHSKSVAGFASPTVLVPRVSTTLLHVGEGR